MATASWRTTLRCSPRFRWPAFVVLIVLRDHARSSGGVRRRCRLRVRSVPRGADPAPPSPAGVLAATGTVCVAPISLELAESVARVVCGRLDFQCLDEWLLHVVRRGPVCGVAHVVRDRAGEVARPGAYRNRRGDCVAATRGRPVEVQGDSRSVCFARDLEEIRGFSADIAALVNGSTNLSLWGWVRRFPQPEGELFPGVALVLLIVMGFFVFLASVPPDGVPAPDTRWRRVARVGAAVVGFASVAALFTIAMMGPSRWNVAGVQLSIHQRRPRWLRWLPSRPYWSLGAVPSSVAVSQAPVFMSWRHPSCGCSRWGQTDVLWAPTPARRMEVGCAILVAAGSSRFRLPPCAGKILDACGLVSVRSRFVIFCPPRRAHAPLAPNPHRLRGCSPRLGWVGE